MTATDSGLTPEHQRHANAVAARLSLRPPQRESLEILARVCEIVPLDKDAQDLAEALRAVRSEFPSVEAFERDFPSLAFALATGVGKTRLMGAFAAYLHRAHGVRHFFVLAPNLTIYEKLKADFTPGTPKYVFQGIAEFAQTPPLLITGENYESSLAVRQTDIFGRDDRVHINVFNISKLNRDAKEAKGAAPRIKRLSEYIGQSYFDYLAGLDDLVLMMDESHRYRADAGVKALNELRPVLGLELTATPQVESGSKTVPFKNVVYSYPLANAIRDGFVKEPAVATRENFRPEDYSEAELERLKLEDGLRLHETVKAELATYARQSDQPRVKPFILVVAQDTAHADALVGTVENLFDGRYKGRVITVHSNQTGEEKEETVQRLLQVEDPDEPTEVVVHVNKLKEGWDVTNLYTIVPLRAANSRTLVEQSIGRGLRLPFGTRTGVPEVDRLTVVSHDRFEEIVAHANDPGSIIRSFVTIGRDVPEKGKEAVTVQPSAYSALLGPETAAGGDGQSGAPPSGATTQDSAPMAPVFKTDAERAVGKQVLDAIESYRSRAGADALPNAEALRRPEVRAEIAQIVRSRDVGSQAALDLDADDAPDLEAVVETATDVVADRTISIPRIVVQPTGEVTAGFDDFDLDTSAIRYQPVEHTILVRHLQSGDDHRIQTQAGVAAEDRLEDYVVRALIDYPDIDYTAHADLLYKLAGQAVEHVRSYLEREEDAENVVRYYEKQLARDIHAQMQPHYRETATAYEAHVTKGFEEQRPLNYTIEPGTPLRPFRNPVQDKARIRSMHFGGFRTCLYDVQKFESDTERQLAVVLEADPAVTKWFRPVPGQLQIYFRKGRTYEPDFVAEADGAKYLIETKARGEVGTDEVQEKKAAAVAWCEAASAHETEHGGKHWQYLLIPHDDVKSNYTLAGLAAKYAA